MKFSLFRDISQERRDAGSDAQVFFHQAGGDHIHDAGQRQRRDALPYQARNDADGGGDQLQEFA